MPRALQTKVLPRPMPWPQEILQVDDVKAVLSSYVSGLTLKDSKIELTSLKFSGPDDGNGYEPTRLHRSHPRPCHVDQRSLMSLEGSTWTRCIQCCHITGPSWRWTSKGPRREPTRRAPNSGTCCTTCSKRHYERVGSTSNTAIPSSIGATAPSS